MTDETPRTAVSQREMRAGSSPLRRLTDADRHAAAKLLGEAVTDGRLALPEYDGRLQAAYAAQTDADLQPLVADLAAPEGRAGRKLPNSLVMLWVTWAAVLAVNVTVWGMLTIAAGGGIYPWPLWIALPSGVALLGVSAIAAIARKTS
jgi:hypothetical protein